MDDLLKQLQGGGGSSGTSGGAGGLGGLLGGGGGGGGLGGLLGGGGLNMGMLGAVAPILPSLLPALLKMLGGSSSGGKTGVEQVVSNMQAQGLGPKADSWVGPGPSEPISPDEAEQALGPDKVQQLSDESGVPKDQVKHGLSALLPGVMNHLTPDGKLPNPDQLQGIIGGLLGR